MLSRCHLAGISVTSVVKVSSGCHDSCNEVFSRCHLGGVMSLMRCYQCGAKGIVNGVMVSYMLMALSLAYTIRHRCLVSMRCSTHSSLRS